MTEVIQSFLKSLNITSTPWINAALTVVFFALIAIIVNLFVVHVLKRLVRFTKSDLDDKIIDLAHKPIFLTIILLSVAYAAGYIIHTVDMDKADRINWMFYMHGIINSIISLLWFIAFIKISNLVISRVFGRLSDVSGMRKDIIPLLSNISKILLTIGELMIILSIWHINITPLLASAGILGIAIAMAAKDTLANFFGGISVFLDKPYKIGDFIELDQKERGEVVDIGIRSTRIKTKDDILITIPNSIIANSKIINESAPYPVFRIKIPVGVAYGSDIDLVQDILIETAKDNVIIHDEPEPRVRLRKFGESSLDFELLCWSDDASRRNETVHEINCAIYKKFTEKGIIIPFPQRDLHIKREE